MNAVCGGKENSQLVIPFKREGFKPKEAKPLLKRQKMYACSHETPTEKIFFHLFNLIRAKESTLIFGDTFLNEVPRDKPLAAQILILIGNNLPALC